MVSSDRLTVYTVTGTVVETHTQSAAENSYSVKLENVSSQATKGESIY